MSFLLDTNLVSELFRPRPDPGVQRWLAGQPEPTLWLSAATWAELRFGAERLPAGKRRADLLRWLEHDLSARYFGRILPVDLAVANMWGVVGARCEAAGAPLDAMDGLIAATALVHDLTLVTRNTGDFTAVGVRLLDPWQQT